MIKMAFLIKDYGLHDFVLFALLHFSLKKKEINIGVLLGSSSSQWKHWSSGKKIQKLNQVFVHGAAEKHKFKTTLF